MSKSNDQVIVGFRVPKAVSEWLKQSAEREERSQNWIVNRLFREAMEAQEKGAAA